MDKREYAEAIAKEIGGEVREVEKTNGVIQTGIEVKIKGKNVAPTIYIDRMYEQDVCLAEAIESIKKQIAEEIANIPEVDTDFIYNYEEVKPKLRARLLNKKTSADVFRSARHYGFSDLIIVPYIIIPMPTGQGSLKVTQALVNAWGITLGITPKQVIDDALKNVKQATDEYFVTSMMSMFMGGSSNEIDSFGLNVCGNRAGCFGAIGVIAKRKELKEVFPEGYIVIPSSVHEVIILPNGLVNSSNEVDNMINEVNSEMVRPEERLGTRAYTIGGK